ncbi:MAG: glycerol kinase [Planctomycetes bacterium]|jgi:glycerol kinase|nr:glycerol kinase [Planctomycetota bacterium]
MSARFILAIDQGTTSTRAIVFDEDGRPVATAQRELPQSYPALGQVEHSPAEIWSATLEVCRGALRECPGEVVAIGITNQRETTIVWDRATGEPLHDAIVWQDRRTAKFCDSLRADGHEEAVTRKTGLLLDPYFSGTKVRWILDNVAGARDAAMAGRLAFGTVDCFLLWKLTGGTVHATDATNASRTLLYDIGAGGWDQELCDLIGVPISLLPEVLDNAADFGATDASLFGRSIPITGMAGDQQAAALGQACLTPGMIKSTYGTGCFALINTGTHLVPSRNRLLSTIAYRLGGETRYALEGSIFAAGSTVQWLRDGLGLIDSVQQSEALARAADPESRVYLVPAFTGLGAPHWDPYARGTLSGLTRGTSRAEVMRAALESVGYQTRDLLAAMRADGAAEIASLRVDGGMAENDFAMQFLADILGVVVERPVVTETTALGAAFLAGLGHGIWNTDTVAAQWKLERSFEPTMDASEREERYAGWQAAVARTLTGA